MEPFISPQNLNSLIIDLGRCHDRLRKGLKQGWAVLEEEALEAVVTLEIDLELLKRIRDKNENQIDLKISG